MKQRVAKAQLAYTTRDRYGTSNSGGPDIGIAICDNEDEDAIGSEPEQRCARDTKIVVIAENRYLIYTHIACSGILAPSCICIILPI